MSLSRILTAALAGLAVGAVAVAMHLHAHPDVARDNSSAVGADDVWVPQQPVAIDATVGETFEPVLAGPSDAADRGLLTADAAFVRGYPELEAPIPASTKVALGYLTLPTSKGSKMLVVDHTLVYSFVRNSCRPAIGPSPPPGQDAGSPVPETRCTEWTFVDAETGEHLDTTWVE